MADNIPDTGTVRTTDKSKVDKTAAVTRDNSHSSIILSGQSPRFASINSGIHSFESRTNEYRIQFMLSARFSRVADVVVVNKGTGSNQDISKVDISRDQNFNPLPSLSTYHSGVGVTPLSNSRLRDRKGGY